MVLFSVSGFDFDSDGGNERKEKRKREREKRGGGGGRKDDGKWRGACVQKNMYCNTIGCRARAPRLLPPLNAVLDDDDDVEEAGTTCFSMRAHVR